MPVTEDRESIRTRWAHEFAAIFMISQLKHHGVRRISIDSGSDWDEAERLARVEWGMRQGPRRGRDADDLAVTVRDLFPFLNNLLSKCGCCTEKKRRTQIRPREHQNRAVVETVCLECGDTLQHNQLPQSIRREVGMLPAPAYGIGHKHGDPTGVYEYRGEVSGRKPGCFEGYQQWEYPHQKPTTLQLVSKAPLPAFQPQAPARVLLGNSTKAKVTEVHNDLYGADGVYVPLPEFPETNDGKLGTTTKSF